MALNSPRFASNSRLQAASENNPPMRRGERGTAVRLVQQALIDLGYPLPISTRRHGSPDGMYESETVGAIRSFQRAERLGGTRQEHVAHDVGAGRSAGLPRHQDWDGELTQPVGEPPGLGRLAGPLPSFESDETSAHLFWLYQITQGPVIPGCGHNPPARAQLLECRQPISACCPR